MAYNTRAPAQNEPLLHPKRRDQDRNRHDRGPAPPKIVSTAAVPTRSSVAYWIPRAMTVAPCGSPCEGSVVEIGDIGEYVEQRDAAGPEHQRQRQVAPRVLHFGRRKGHRCSRRPLRRASRRAPRRMPARTPASARSHRRNVPRPKLAAIASACRPTVRPRNEQDGEHRSP